MEFKGTQGKWEVSIYNPHGRVQVNLGELKGHLDIWYHNGHSMTREEAYYNALLISKAPEMLEMLKEILDTVDWSDNVWVNLEGGYIENKIEKLIKEATEI